MTIITILTILVIIKYKGTVLRYLKFRIVRTILTNFDDNFYNFGDDDHKVLRDSSQVPEVGHCNEAIGLNERASQKYSDETSDS